MSVRDSVSHWLRRRVHESEVAGLRDAPWRDPVAMDRQRLDGLRTTLEIAADVPYYRAVLDVAPGDIQSFDDLRSVPVTRKADIVESGLPRWLAGSRLHRRRNWGTSGSSGQPMVFRVDRFYAVRHAAGRAYAYEHEGLPRGSRIVEMVGGTSPGDRVDPEYSTFQRRVVGYTNPDLVERTCRLGADLVYGNLSHLLQIATHIAETGDDRLRPSIVCSSSETMHAGDENHLRSAFGADVMEIYGSAEASNIAFRSRGGSTWQVLEPRILVEVLDSEGNPVDDGAVGEITVTTLREPVTPLVRYGTGDLARLAPGSPNGTSGMRLASLDGREEDLLVRDDATTTPGFAVTTSGFWATPDLASRVRRFQVHQEVDRSIVVSLELKDGASVSEVRDRVTEFVSSIVGDLPIEVASAASIHDASQGKFRPVTSLAPR